MVWWRRSIQARVVVTIVTLSAIVIVSGGLLVLREISGGLVSSRVNASITEAAGETQSGRYRLDSAGSGTLDPATQLNQLVGTLMSRAGERDYDVIVLGPVNGDPARVGVRSTPLVDPGSVPEGLRDAVQHRPGLSWTFTTARYLPASHRASRPAVVVGSEVVLPSDGGRYALFFVFPMTDEQATLYLVRRSLLTAGLLLLLLIAAVAWLVVRQVITPVRLARRTAERIASGRLEERMAVRGQDDLARLATSLNSMADSLQQQIRQLVELSRVQRTFVSDVSHELRTPLTTVRLAGDVLHDARSGFDPVTARAAELLQTELDRFEALLADLLEISRFDAGAASLELDAVDLVDVAHRVAGQSLGLAEKRGVTIDVISSGPCVAEFDVRRIDRIVRNLVHNAIDHAGGTGEHVVVTVARDEDTVAMTVRDHGVGLSAGQAAMVFNRFWRADPARARTSGGSGLGLAIALEDARLHGGWLQVWGAPGGGAQFRLTLPRRAGDALTSSPLPLIPVDVTDQASRPSLPAGPVEPVRSRAGRRR